MAYVVNSSPLTWPLGVVFAIGRFFKTIFLSAAIAGSYDSRMRDIEKLNRLSDEQLASMGLKRDEIVRHVYQALFYL